MALWEFIVIAALVGALLVYASVLTSRIGRTNALLKRVEALLLLKGGLGVPAAAGAVETAPSPEVADEVVDQEAPAAAPFLTMRDLKVRSELERSRAVRSNSGNLDPIVERRRRESGNPFAGRLESSDPKVATPTTLNTGGELTAVPASHDEKENPIAASSESNESESIAVQSIAVLAASDELTSAPAPDPLGEDSAAKKEQEAWLILNSQRRRRRTRYGH